MVYILELAKTLTSQPSDYKLWVDAQKILFRVKNYLYEDYTILDSVNPFILFLKNDDTMQRFEDNFKQVIAEENVYSVSQVWVWMLNEYYSTHYDLPSPTEKWDLFQGLLTFATLKHEVLFRDHRALLRDIFKLAGRLSRWCWKDSDHYQNAIGIVTQNLVSRNDRAFVSFYSAYLRLCV